MQTHIFHLTNLPRETCHGNYCIPTCDPKENSGTRVTSRKKEGSGMCLLTFITYPLSILFFLLWSLINHLVSQSRTYFCRIEYLLRKREQLQKGKYNIEKVEEDVYTNILIY